MAKSKSPIVRGVLNRYAIQRLIRAAQQLHHEGLLSDAELRDTLSDIEGRRLPGAGTGMDEIENAKADLDAASNQA